MKKQNLLLSLVILLTFMGGYLVGVLYPTNNAQQFIVKNNPLSTKEYELKEAPKLTEKVLIGYVQDYRDTNMIPYANLTHVIFSFAHPTKDGSLLLNGEIAEKNLRTIREKAHDSNTKVMLAIGGWYHIHGGESYAYFKEAISNPTSQDKLIREIQNIVEKEKLDGIDIDFEHPRSQNDALNLANFIKELDKALGNKELSIAVSAKVHSIAGTELNNVVYDVNMFEHVDHVNIMAYDGQWDGEYNAANLSPFKFNENIVSYWTRLFDSHKIARDKLVLGIPSYGQPEDPNIKQVSYAVILSNNKENAKQDTVQMNGTTYHYNGIATVQKKTDLAMNNGLGGMMLWEVGLDAQGNNSITHILDKELKKNQLFTLK